MNAISRAVRAEAMVSCVNVEKGRQYACKQKRLRTNVSGGAVTMTVVSTARLERIRVAYRSPSFLTSYVLPLTPLPYLLFMSF